MKKIIVFFLIGYLQLTAGYGQTNYLSYHKTITQCEELIATKKYESAIAKLDSVFEQYDFIFLREIKLAAQLSIFIEKFPEAFHYIELGIQNGWSLKSIRKESFYKKIKLKKEWKEIEQQYPLLIKKHENSISKELRNQVRELFKKDQRMAFGALLRIGDKAQEKYGTRKFAPHSKNQLAQLNKVFEEYGYPGEKLIGNNWMVSTILSHHNSISKKYVVSDTLFYEIQPKLYSALLKGEISPFEYALVHDWKTAVTNEHNSTSYGFIGSIRNKKALQQIDDNRTKIGLRSIELRNKLFDVQEATGMKLYLPGGNWQEGKISIIKD